MRVVIDLQSLQTGSAGRGIGRYSCSLVRTLLNISKDSEFYLLLNNSAFNKVEQTLLDEFIQIVGKEKIVYFPVPQQMNCLLSESSNIIRVAEIVREQFIELLKPDVLITTSLFEFDAITSIPHQSKRSYTSAVILYDLIPLSDPDHYLSHSKVYDWYFSKLDSLKNADVVLTISQFTLDDAVNKIGLNSSNAINISGASDLVERFQLGSNEICTVENFENRPYVLYVGGFDKRKNVNQLIRAFALQPREIIEKYSLVLVGKILDIEKDDINRLCRKLSLPVNCVSFFGFAPDDTLAKLYTECELFVFPSDNEGFGLPPLEAMGFGSPVIASNRASLTEVVKFEELLFNPDELGAFSQLMTRALIDDEFRQHMKLLSKNRAQQFTWKKSATQAIEFIKSIHNNRKQCLNTNSDLDVLLKEISLICTNKIELIEAAQLISEAVTIARNLRNSKIIDTNSQRLYMIESFSSDIPAYPKISAPYVFSSGLCRQQHFRMPLYTYWCNQLAEKPRFHRKQWEFVFICQVLFERGYLTSGMSGIGFGVGKEPLVSYFASQGVEVLATDLEMNKAQELGWVSTEQHSNDLLSLNERGLCPQDDFVRLAKFINVDMNHIPKNIGNFDFCWSSCAFEHLGSIRKGLDFVINSARLLKPGGIAVHTTEYNLTSNDRTLDNNPSFVIFRRRDIEQHVNELQLMGYQVEPIDFSPGNDELERYVDLPPYLEEPHLRLQLAGEFTSTSIGLIIRAPALAN